MLCYVVWNHILVGCPWGMSITIQVLKGTSSFLVFTHCAIIIFLIVQPKSWHEVSYAGTRVSLQRLIIKGKASQIMLHDFRPF